MIDPLAKRLGRSKRRGFLTLVLRERPHPTRPLKLERLLVKFPADDHMIVQRLHIGIGQRISGERLIEFPFGVEDLKILDVGVINGLPGHAVGPPE